MKDVLKNGRFEVADTNSENVNKQLDILRSMAGIYYSVHLIDLTDNTFYEYSSMNIVKELVEEERTAGADDMMRRVMYATMSDAFLPIGLGYTDVTTLAERMKGKKFLSMDLLGKNVGWIRMLFITIDADEDGVPRRVICTTQIIDEEKKREERLLKESNTDELTGCLNRRAYEDDLIAYAGIPKEPNFVFVAMDLNGLKVTNDTLGHDAGDELIVGAVKCIRRCLGNYGRIYRTGGDEFVAIIFADEKILPEIIEDFEIMQNSWKGKKVDRLSISYGYVTKKEFPDLDVSAISKIADQRMYDAKAEYYRNKGVDRRGQMAAHTALCALYTKILKIDITEDTYQIVNMDIAEQTAAKGFAETISGWLSGFGKSGQVHPDDLDEYLKKTDVKYLNEYFKQDKTSISIQYRRKYGNTYKQVVMDMIPANDYSHEHQKLFLYVKSIDK